MLKRYIALTICIIMVFSLVGCGRVEKEEDIETMITQEEREVLSKAYTELDDTDHLSLPIIEIKLRDPESGATEEDKENYERLMKEKEEYIKELEAVNRSEEVEVDPKTIRKSEIEAAIRNRINEGDYTDVKLDKITINEDMGKDEEGYYIALVRLNFQVKNRRKTANEMMRMYSDDLVATLAKKGIEDISQAAIFWRDEYNDRDLKYAYEYKNGGFYITDIMGE